MKDYSKDLADTIIWISQERMKEEPFQDINSAIHATELDMKQYLMDFMSINKIKKQKTICAK